MHSPRRRRWPGVAGVVLCCAFIGASAAPWLDLDSDDLHDPANPGLKLLQQPAEALSHLPPDTAGNKVDWIRALQGGYIKPRSSLLKDAEVKVLDSDIVMPETSTLPMVRFPHKAHTQWLDCGNCHEKIFKSKAGATPVNMFKILQGQYCGVCHGAVSFPLTECNRCHSVRDADVPEPASATP